MFIGRHGCLSVLSKILDSVAKKNYIILKYVLYFSIMIKILLCAKLLQIPGYVQKLLLHFLNKVCITFIGAREVCAVMYDELFSPRNRDSVQ